VEDYVANNARAYRPRYFTGDDSYEKDNFKQHKKKLDHDSVAYDDGDNACFMRKRL
jgi:hypothetical protein